MTTVVPLVDLSGTCVVIACVVVVYEPVLPTAPCLLPPGSRPKMYVVTSTAESTCLWITTDGTARTFAWLWRDHRPDIPQQTCAGISDHLCGIVSVMGPLIALYPSPLSGPEHQPVRGRDRNNGDVPVLGDVLPHQASGGGSTLPCRGPQSGPVEVCIRLISYL